MIREKCFNPKTNRYFCTFCKSFISKDDTRCPKCGGKFGSKVYEEPLFNVFSDLQKLFPASYRFLVDESKRTGLTLSSTISHYAVLGIKESNKYKDLKNEQRKYSYTY